MPALRDYRIFISHAWTYNDHYHKLVEWFDGAPLFKWFDHSVPEHDPLPPGSNKRLSDALHRQIQGCHCVVVMGGMYVNHREWIQHEIDIARRFQKPIIAVRPLGAVVLPKALTDVAHEVVSWRQVAVVDAIRRHAL